MGALGKGITRGMGRVVLKLCKQCKQMPNDPDHPGLCCLCYEESFGEKNHDLLHNQVEKDNIWKY